MTTNFVWIKEGLSIRQAMSEVVRQAGVHDNIMTVYVVDESNSPFFTFELTEENAAWQYRATLVALEEEA